MSIGTRARRIAAVWGALTVLLALPRFASAQANALFPDIYIKRQRPCPSLEDPRYRYIRENYYGYFPTCWRKFPDGWGCPSVEAPNWNAELARLPLTLPKTDEGTDTSPVPRDDPFMRNQPRTAPTLPEVPNDEGSLFRPGGAQPATNPDQPDGDPNQPTKPLDLPQTPAGDSARPDGSTPPATNPPQGDVTAPAGTNPNGSTTALPPAADAAVDGVAPPLAPPSASIPGAFVPAPPGSRTGEDGVVRTSVRSPQRRGPIAQFVNRIRRK